MFKKIRKFWWLTSNLIKKHYFFIILGALLSATASATIIYSLRTQKFEKTEKIGIIGNYTSKNIPIRITKLLSRGLTKKNANDTYSTDLAEKITISNNGKIYNITIKKNVKWQNGKTFTTKDINYNFKDVNFIVKNDYEGYFILKENFSPFLKLLSIPITDKNLNGVGKYKIVNIEYDGDFIKKIHLNGEKEIIFRFYPNEKIAITAFKLGEINKIEDLYNLENLKQWRKIKIEKKPDVKRFAAIFFNFKSNFIGTEKAFRQALAYSINKKNFDEKNALSSFSPTSYFYNKDIKKYSFNPNQAKKQLEKITTNTSKIIQFTLYVNPEYEKYAKIIAKEWNQNLNTKVNVKISRETPYQWQAYLTVVEIPDDPDQYAIWHSNKTFRFSNYHNVKIDKLLEDGRTEIDIEKRKEIYFELQKTLTEDLPAIFLFYPNAYTISY